MKTIPVLLVVAGAALVWWALTEFQVIGPQAALKRDPATGKRIPGGYESPHDAAA